jgi:uncharacterized protein (DUF2384 family)
MAVAMTATPTLEITPAEALRVLVGDTGLADDELAPALGVTPRALARWRAGASYPQREARSRLARLLRLDERIRAAFEGDEAVRQWLRAENAALGLLTPAEVLKAGRLDRVEAALTALESGIVVSPTVARSMSGLTART